MHIHFIIHEAFEVPGAYLEWAEDRNHSISFSKVYMHHPLPKTAAGIDMLIVMGGPQSPSTTKEECQYFDAAAETRLIQQCIKAGKAVVGVCLGAQLIGEAMGAQCTHSPEKEIGVFPIQLTDMGLKNGKFNHFGSSLLAGHWHSDMPGLTPDSKVIAISEGCPRQIVEYTDLVYGFQCHMEFNPEVIELLIASEQDICHLSEVHRFIQHPDEIRNCDYREMNEKLFTFLDKLAETYSSSIRLPPATACL